MTPKQLRELRGRKLAGTGNKLADAFSIVGCTRTECGDETGFTAQYIHDMLKGRYKNISIDNARKFSDFFGCAIEDLFPARDEAVA